MKNLKFLSLIVAVVMLTSCGGGGFEADVRKMGDMSCKYKKMMNDTTKKEELKKLEGEMDAYIKKMDEKYKDKKDDKAMNEKADKILKEIEEKCK